MSTRLSTNTTKQSTPAGALTNLTGVWPAYALEGKMEEATSALAEARRLNPQLTVNG